MYMPAHLHIVADQKELGHVYTLTVETHHPHCRRVCAGNQHVDDGCVRHACVRQSRSAAPTIRHSPANHSSHLRAIGDGSTTGLQFGDPTEGLALIQPPGASNDGGAHLSYPLLIPKGRGIAPDLSLQYDSGGGNGWVGQGWDLSVGEISVDTRWGAPRFDANRESETYLLDGDMLIPNSLGATWAPRVHGDRQDYTRQVETQYQQIIRHEVPGEGPSGLLLGGSR